MKLSISEILEKAHNAKTRDERIEFLRKQWTPQLGVILRLVYDPRYEFDLPKGKVPYKPCDLPDHEGRLYVETRRLYIFLKGHNTPLTPAKRERLFIEILESINNKDAELLIAVKDKKMPYTKITHNMLNRAFPGMLPPEPENEKKDEGNEQVEA